MADLKGFTRGVNLGGWMSQCDYSDGRLDGFITEPDFEKIAAWGFDHVRLPVDYNVIRNPDGTAREEGLRRVDRALDLCGRYGLNTVLDLHKTRGFSFDPGEMEQGFFSSEEDQTFFYGIWEDFARRYGGRSESVMFDLLNELTDAAYLPAWMRISRECVRRIRRYAPEVRILLGGYDHNSVDSVLELPPPFDGNVVYNFHCYDPHTYTHQGAYWMADVLDLSVRIPFADTGVTEEYFLERFGPAVRKASAEGTALYCGEYGVIDVVPPEDSMGWFRAIHAAFEKCGIGRCLWSYREMDFGLSDRRMDAVREELLRNV